jgi:type IV secretory pathway VirJ component
MKTILPGSASRRGSSSRALRWIGGIALVASAALLVVAAIAGFFDRDPIRLFGDFGRGRVPVVALFFSGDLGLRFGMGPHVTQGLAVRGIPVMGVNSPTVFGRHRSRAEVDGLVADAVRGALARAHADRVVLIGQSFGSDVLGTGAARLPADLKSKVAAIVLVVPGQTVFFRADPTSLAYRGTPDAQALDAARTLSWAPLTCIYGARETDSLCPLLAAPVKRIALPGGHFLDNDPHRLVATILGALRPVLPGMHA